MTTNKTLHALTIAAVTGILCGTALAEATHGTWIRAGAKGNIDTNKVYSVNASIEGRFGEDELDEQHAIVGFGIKPFDWLTIGPHYHVVDSRKKKSGGGHYWEKEHRVAVDVTPSYTLGGWKISDRSRIAYRDFENSQGFWRYRNRIQVNSPWKWTDWKINPYASWELFLDDGKPSKHVRKNDKFDQWRFVTGVTAKVTDNLSLNLFYLLQEKKDTSTHDWRPNHVVGLYATYSF